VLDAGVARRAGIPTVTTVHGFTGGDWKNRVYEWVQTRAFRRFDAVVAVSRPLQLRLVQSGVPAERIHVVPNAWSHTAPALERVDARRALGLPLDAFVIGWVGRLSQEKGPDVLLEALDHVADLPLTASFIGDGGARPRLEEQARRSHPNGRVRWHGTARDAGTLFTAFDLFVLSSRTEGSPIVLFEAMAAGVPVIATAVGGVPDAVSPEEAVLVPAEHPAALAAAIRAAYRAPAVAQARAARARERLRREFAPRPWAERYERIYRHVASGVDTALVSA
jgi:glycosyltransferase involved in cell wall biosynthesis